MILSLCLSSSLVHVSAVTVVMVGAWSNFGVDVINGLTDPANSGGAAT